MSLNFAETIQKNLGYPPLKKIDFTTENVKTAVTQENYNLVGQAAIPAILIALYKYSLTNAGAENILCRDISTNWLNEFLGDSEQEVVSHVAAYAGTSKDTARENMKNIAWQAINIVRESNPVTVNDVKELLIAEKNNVLLYLPPAMHIGDLLNDNAVDDNTHKMEGPVSSLMNAIGNIFSESEKEGRK